MPKLNVNGKVRDYEAEPDTPLLSDDGCKSRHSDCSVREKNPQRKVVKFSLGPRCGKESVSTRIRLATT